MSRFKVTIIIVTYNAGKFIEECIQSIVNRQIASLQLIIMDGGSTDDTLQILASFREHIDVLVSEKDKGIYDAMNKALPYIKGSWVLFMGADDRLLPSFSEMEEQLEDPNTIYYGDCVTSDGILGDAFSRYRLTKMSICHQGIFYPAQVFRKYTYQLQYIVYADHILNMQCWGDPAFLKKYLPVKVCYYNLTGFSSYGDDKIFWKDKARMIRRHLGWITYIRYRYKKIKKKGFR